MNKENVLFGVAGILAGMVIGFMFANSINQGSSAAGTPAKAPAITANSNIPPGHPDIGGGGGATTGQPGAMGPEVMAAIEKAKSAPDDVEAQTKAADLYYQIGRFDDAIKFLTIANKLKPDDVEIMVHLGNANFDGDHYDEAERWYTLALAKKPDAVSVRTDLGLTFVFREPANYDRAIQEFNKSLAIDPNHVQTLQNLTVAYTKKGDIAKAKASLAKLESVEPTNEAIANLKTEIEKAPAK